LRPSAGLVTGNTYDKYRTANPLHRALMHRFLEDAADLVRITDASRVLEIGCGPGDLAARLFPGHAGRYCGVDVGPAEVARARRSQPQLEFIVSTAYRLPFAGDSFDLVVACEVFEHLERPESALTEVARVCRGHLLVSVPWEPMWRALNLARGAYWRRLGNTPGHLQQFSRRSIRRMVGRRFDLRLERRPFPWTMLLARTRDR
jgi:ubiquinone/menaquinone biosynthesis C-methylase UbiE